MSMKGKKVWWKCKRYNLFVYKDMCSMACFAEEISVCEDRINKPEKAVAPIAQTLKVRLNKMMRKKKEEKENGKEKKRA